MATLTGHLVAETYKSLLKMIDNDVVTASEKQISDGLGGGLNVFVNQNGQLRANKYKVTGATASQFLKGDGTLDSTSYLPTGTSTTSIPEGTNKYFTELRVLNSILAGFTPTSGTVTSTDSVLTAIQKIWWNIVNGGGGGGGGYVPYTGATQNLNLGEYGINTGFVGFDLTPTNTPTSVGTMSWNDQDGTAELKLKGGNVTLQLGQESLIRVVNKTGSNLLEANYQAVRISGAQGNRLKVDLAQANNDANSAETIGLVTETINNNNEGFITTSGIIHDINTTGSLQGETWVDGDMLYLSGTTAGKITNVKPQAPIHTVIIGYVVRAHATQGQIFVKVDNGYELDELHNVKITSATENDFLVYDSTNSLWENRSIIKNNGYLPYFDSTDLFKQAPIYTNGTKIAVGVNSFYGTNILTAQGGIWSEELTLNDIALFHTSSLSGNFFISRWSGTNWDVKLGFYANQITSSVDIEATKFIKTGGLATQFLMANGNTETVASLNILSGAGTIGFIPKYDGSTITLANSVIFQNNTSIGIGTTNPTTKLEVRGGAIGVYSSASYYGKQEISNNDYMFTSGSGFYFKTNDATATVFAGRINNSGNWGIGILNPTQKLDVNGNINIATGSNYLINGSQLNTDNIPQGSTNQYLTEAGLYPFMYNFQSGEIRWNVVTHQFYMNQVSNTANGWLANTDFVNFNTAYSRSITSASVSGTTTKTLTLNQQGGGTITASWSDLNTDAVTSVFGRTGAVVATSGDYNTSQVTESGNLYYTDARARASLSFVAGSGAYNSTTGVITIPTNTNQLTNGAGFITGITSGMITTALGYTPVPNTRTITINGTAYDLSADRSWTISGTIGGLTTNYIPKATSASTLGNSLIFDNGSGVVVGGTTATTILTVNDASYPIISFNSSNVNRGFIGLNGVSGLFNVGSAGNFPLVFYTNNSERVRIDTSGNVGIGTSSPSAKLEILGGNIRLANTAQIEWGGSTNAIDASNATNVMRFWTNNVQRLTIDASGNLGLGVTPSAWSTGKSFEINLSGNSIWSYGQDNIYLLSNSYFNGGWKYGGNGYATNYTQYQGQHQWLTAGNNTSGAGTAISFTQAMTLDASGTLLIGQTSNTGKGAKINITQGSTNTNAIDIKSATGTTYAHYGTFANNTYLSQNYYYAGGQNADDLALGQAAIVLSAGTTTSNTAFIDFNLSNPGATNPSSLMRLNVSGNLSIGNTNNTYKLDVSGTGRYSGTLYLTTSATLTMSNSANTSNFDIGLLGGSGDANAYIYQRANSNMIFATNNTERMRITSSGNVGIGTTSPSYLLDVKGDVSVGKSSTANKLRIARPSDGDATNTYLGFNSTSSNISLILANNNTNGEMAFQVNSSEVMRIDYLKNVLVGFSTYNLGGGGGIRVNQVNGLDAGIVIKAVDILMGFYNSSNSVVGVISHNGTNTNYGTSSDYRLKTDLRSFNGLQLLDKINVYDFAWKVDNSRMFGVMAHELQEILPYAVTGIKDGNSMQGVDYSKIVPILVQSIKELKAKIENLEANSK